MFLEELKEVQKQCAKSVELWDGYMKYHARFMTVGDSFFGRNKTFSAAPCMQKYVYKWVYMKWFKDNPKKIRVTK